MSHATKALDRLVNMAEACLQGRYCSPPESEWQQLRKDDALIRRVLSKQNRTTEGKS